MATKAEINAASLIEQYSKAIHSPHYSVACSPACPVCNMDTDLYNKARKIMELTKEKNMELSPEQKSDRGPFVATLSGAYFFIYECNIEDIPVEDMAHALSMNVRFNGHIKRFYSVAEHSCYISDLAGTAAALAGMKREEVRRVALWGLLHDITEAFVPDIPRPFKPVIVGFKEYEDKLAQKVARQYNLSWPMPDLVKYMDTNIVRLEAEVLFPNPPIWTNHYDDLTSIATEVGIEPQKDFGQEPDMAFRMFMDRYESLTGSVA